MNAEQMFEELGYQRNTENEKIIYLIETKGSFYYQEIIFNLVQKVIVIDGNFLEVAIESDLLKAINKQAEELGWIEPEQKQETNYEHYKDKIIENSGFCFALADGKPCQCSDISCSECGFSTGYGCSEKIKEWLNKPYEKPKYKITQFEYDLLSVHKDYKTYNNIANQIHLFKMREKGYFKDVNTKIPICEILDNCEVIK